MPKETIGRNVLNTPFKSYGDIHEQKFQRFIGKILEGFRKKSRPDKPGIDKIFKKLKDKAEYATRPSYLDIIGDASKSAFEHVPEGSRWKDYAWSRHLEVDKEIKRKSDEFRKTISSRVKIGGQVATGLPGVAKLQGGVEVERTEEKNPPS
jgi:hypothetical protein